MAETINDIDGGNCEPVAEKESLHIDINIWQGIQVHTLRKCDDMNLISLTILITWLAGRHSGRENYKLHLCHGFVMYIYGRLQQLGCNQYLHPLHKWQESLQVLLVGAHMWQGQTPDARNAHPTIVEKIIGK